MSYWMICIAGLLTFLLSACGPASTSTTLPETTETTLNPDSTRTVARKVNGELEGRALTYWPSGELAGISYLHKGQLEGIQRRFFANGHLGVWQRYHRSKLHGASYEFFENGAPASITHYANGQRQGYYVSFYEPPGKGVYEYIMYVIGEGHEWKTRYLKFDTQGRLVERWGFLQVSSPRDTIGLGDTLTLNLSERYPKHEHIAVVTGNFDKQFRLRDSTDMGRIEGQGYAATLHLPAYKSGQQVVRGYLEDFQPGPRRADGTTVVHGQRLYFAYPYFVR